MKLDKSSLKGEENGDNHPILGYHEEEAKYFILI